MNAGLKVVLGHLFGWCFVLFLVVLLTLVFSFLGTIICAALAGLMMGSNRFSCWRACLVSLVFPGVISAVLLIYRAEVPGAQIVMLCLLCSGVFWAIYGVMYALSNPDTATTRTSPAGPEAASAAACPISEPEDATGTTSRKIPAQAEKAQAGLRASVGLTLEALQGIWFVEAGKQDPSRDSRRLEIRKDLILLSVVDAKGEEKSRVEAQLHVKGSSLHVGTPESLSPAE